MNKFIFFLVFSYGVSAFAGGSEVNNPWPWPEATEEYDSSASEYLAVLQSQEVKSLAGKHGKIESITRNNSVYTLRMSKSCEVQVEVTYNLPIPSWPPAPMVEQVSTNCR